MTMKTKKVVVLACSGIGKVYGALARETTYELMDRVRPGVVVTTCLPLLVVEDPEALQLISDNPVMTIDGCPKSCAQKSVQAHGVKAAKTYQAINFYKAHKELKPDGIAELDANGLQLAAVSADELAHVVDELAAGEET